MRLCLEPRPASLDSPPRQSPCPAGHRRISGARAAWQEWRFVPCRPLDRWTCGSDYDAIMAGGGRARPGVATVAVGCAVLLSAGCTAAKPASPAAHRPASAASAAGGFASGSARRALAARYLAIANAGNRRLNAAFGRLRGRDRNRLAAAEADLKGAAATERWFDRRLLEIAFPSRTEQAARVLYRVNQARAALTTAAAASTSLRQLHTYQRRLTAANRPVEEAVKTIRRQLGLPPPSTS